MKATISAALLSKIHVIQVKD